jgi:hypothetical protein
MTLKDKIQEELKTAMRAKDQIALRTLRALKAAILVKETEAGRTTGALTPDEDMALLTKQAKQRRDSLDQFRSAGREDLAVTEEEELEVIERFLPKQMSEAEIEAEVRAIVEQTGASSMKDMGKVMGMASKKMAGKADGKVISTIVKSLLS